MNIGFLSTRLAGTDGVSLETAKLATILRRLGHDCCFCAGALDPMFTPGDVVPEMHFAHPEVVWIQERCFGTDQAAPGLEERIAEMAARLRAAVAHFVEARRVDVLFVQNALSIPMHVPLGVALTDLIEETGIPTLAHNHDLPWERERFARTAVPHILERCFPPDLPSVRHLVINSLARRELERRKGLQSALLPNIMDFAAAAPGISEFNADLRRALGLNLDHLMILQPTRVVPRKGIELAVELVRCLSRARSRWGDKEMVLVLSHPAGDEGFAYLEHLREQARRAGVPLIYAADQFAAERGRRNGRKIYALWDAYVHADFVTYPSFIEGFGNALLEAIYFRLPILVNRYPVYVADIAPLGFDLIEIDARPDAASTSAIPPETAEAVMAAIFDPVRRRQMVERNYELARQHFSYETVTPLLADLLKSLGELTSDR